jgi:hypothetical protein
VNKKLAVLLVAGAFVALVGAGLTRADSSAKTAKTATTPTVPQVSVKYAYYPCCADSSLPLVAIQQGFFKDVGITINPQHGGQYTDASQTTPAMQRGTYDISAQYVPAYLDTLPTFGLKLPATMLYDIYLGDMILKAPDNKAKTALDFMKQGMSYKQAAAKAMAQMKGATLYTDPFSSAQPPFYNLFLSYAGLTTKDLHMTFLADTKTLALSQVRGRVEYAFPLAAPIVVILLHNGWQPMISSQQILQYDPHGTQAKQLAQIIGGMGLQTQVALSTNNHDTLLRFISAIYRTIAYTENPKTAPTADKIVADVINATQGTKLTPGQVGEIYKSIDPLFSWENQGSTFWNPKSPYYAPASFKGQINALVANGTMPKGDYSTKLAQFLAAKSIYYEMKADEASAKSLIAKASAKSLTGTAAADLAKAKQYFGWYDFLDAKQFAQAALA